VELVLILGFGFIHAMQQRFKFATNKALKLKKYIFCTSLFAMLEVYVAFVVN